MKKKNILLIMADQLTAFGLQCYGTRYSHTPNLDRLAAKSTIFQNAYNGSPLCTPARYMFMTGQYLSRIQCYDNASYLPSTVPTFAHYLRKMGYRTALSGKMHFVGSDQLHGFEERYTTDVYPADFGWVPDWTKPNERIDLWYHNMSSVKQSGIASITNQLAYDDEVGAASLRAIYDYRRSNDDRNFCLVSSFIHPHDPYAARKKYWDYYDNKEIEMPHNARPRKQDNDPHNLRLEKVIALDAVDIDEEDIYRSRRAYLANVSYVDEWVGRLMDALEETQLSENTSIIFTSDHGDMLGEFGLWYKMSFREWASRIPMIIYDPDHQHKIVASPVNQLDITKTLMDIAAFGNDRNIPEEIDPLVGNSMMDIARNESTFQDRVIKGEYLAEGVHDPMLMIRDKDYKYITCGNDPDQLFDVKNDPHEVRNLACLEGYKEIAEKFSKEASNHWDAPSLKEKIIADQRRRRLVSDALKIGKYHSWDWNPERIASEEYTRSHRDLTEFDGQSRYPRAASFQPRWK